jgi:hypothetical protein
MTYGSFQQDGKGSEAEHCPWTSRPSGSTTGGHAAPFTQIRVVRSSGLSVFGGGLPARSPGRSYRAICSDHVEASATHSGTAAEARKRPRHDYGFDRSGRVEGFSGNAEEAWLRRAPGAARRKSTSIMSLTACTGPNSRRPTISLFPLGNVPSIA